MMEPKKTVYLVDGERTPFLKARNTPGPFSASDLAVGCIRPLLVRQPFHSSELNEVVTGCMIPSADEANISRLIALRVGCGKHVPAYTVQRNCASGLQALHSAMKDIISHGHDLVLAGGTEAMSHSPLLFNAGMAHWLGQWVSAKTFTQRLRLIPRFSFKYLTPVIGLLRGLTDPLTGLNMGQTAEELAHRFHIHRLDMDNFAMESHLRLAASMKAGYYPEITPLYDEKGKVYDYDDGVRPDSTLEKLGKLKPFFDKTFGQVTAGNSSQITDGAAFLLLASEEAVKKYHLTPKAKIIDVQWAGVEPNAMGLGPVHAVAQILQRQQMAMDDIDFWEINEAFAAQVLACIAAWKDETYCKQALGLTKPLGTLSMEKVNIDGGAIAIGHPVGASGARLVLHLLHVLERQQGRYGMATLCIGGGQGGAMLVERV
ncbi:MAG: acetyl-CoA C-acetyltransferase [Gammaproteobacteria bacterium]